MKYKHNIPMKMLTTVLLLLLTLAVTLSGCAYPSNQVGDSESTTTTVATLTDGTDFSALPENLKAEVEAAYIEKLEAKRFPGWMEEGGLVHYYGVYNGCVVLFEFTDQYKVYELEVADSKFIFRSSYVLLAYQNGEFKDLPDAYEAGWLTKENIAKIKVCYEQMLKENNG